MEQIYQERMTLQPSYQDMFAYLANGNLVAGIGTVTTARKYWEDGTCRFKRIPRMGGSFPGVLYFRKGFPYRKLFDRQWVQA